MYYLEGGGSKHSIKILSFAKFNLNVVKLQWANDVPSRGYWVTPLSGSAWVVCKTFGEEEKHLCAELWASAMQTGAHTRGVSQHSLR